MRSRTLRSWLLGGHIAKQPRNGGILLLLVEKATFVHGFQLSKAVQDSHRIHVGEWDSRRRYPYHSPSFKLAELRPTS